MQPIWQSRVFTSALHLGNTLAGADRFKSAPVMSGAANSLRRGSNATAWPSMPRSAKLFARVLRTTLFPASNILRGWSSSAGRLPVRFEGNRRHHDQEVPQVGSLRRPGGQTQPEFPERGTVREGVPASLRSHPVERGPAAVRVLPVLADRLRARPGHDRRSG